MNAPKRLEWIERRTPEVRAFPWGSTETKPTSEAIAPPAAAALEIPEPAAEDPCETRDEKAEAIDALDAELSGLRAELAAAQTDLAAAHAAIDTLKADVERARREGETKRGALYVEAERELVRMSFAIARKIIGRELATSPELLVDWVRNTIEEADLQEDLNIALSPDLATSMARDVWGDLASLVVSDSTLPPATTELRDGTRAIRVGADERLALVADELGMSLAETDTKREAA
ncbi:hypothetical protein AKJ09_01372 [Labilithrix luteola]|uniref:Flagellar assembly protein FliH n=1 Tax=Labilithrix luteola TaxID=1391654 RepID=A0A0K1PMF9_9BACT|nr:FliH/SctL family protein [Labilithrix luteola]AKU94708.1 hypothetical protein AKJ09_01372 [Labilithrix luteola]